MLCNITLSFLYFILGTPRESSSTRANTLMDDADDIQKQLDNEAKDRLKFGMPKTIWVFHIPIQAFTTKNSICRRQRDAYVQFKTKSKQDPKETSKEEEREKERERERQREREKQSEEPDEVELTDWSYKDQNQWVKTFPLCGGRSQSPVNLPYGALLSTRGSRRMLFSYYNVNPTSMVMMNTGKTVSLMGEWPAGQRPLIYGGAAHSRRYMFHSLNFHWPSEHTVGGLQYPLESHAIHVAIEYPTIEEALKAATKDKMAILSVANIYKYTDHDQHGLPDLLKIVLSLSYGNRSVSPYPLSTFNPPMKEYAAYHGSLTVPPCTETVLWLVRARPLPITREFMDILQGGSFSMDPGQIYFRLTQPLNDRRIYFFN